MQFVNKVFKSFSLVLSLAFIGAFMGGCAQTQLAAHAIKQIPFPDEASQSAGLYKVGNPYKIMGRAYFPKEQFNHTETGIASWYGPNFHGKPTANGETFNKYDLTAAHRTLQIPSLVRVTNLDNGRSLVLRVNDRGPYSRGRILDVSERGAELLGFKNNGTAKIKLEVLGPESRALKEMAQAGHSTRGTEIAMNKHGRLPSEYNVRGKASDDIRLASNTNTYGQNQVKKDNVNVKASPFGNTVKLTSTNTPSVQASGTIGGEPVSLTSSSIQVAQRPVAPQQLNAQPLKPTPLKEEVVVEELVAKVPVAPSSIYVQAGAFSNMQNAEALRARLADISNVIVKPTNVNGQNFYRVRVGPIADVSAADSVLNAVIDRGFESAMIVVD